MVVSNMEPENTCHKAQFFSWHFSDLRRRLCGGMCWWDFGIASVFSLIMLDSTFKSDEVSIFVGHFSIRGNFILFCENPQKRFPILRHVHLHSRRNSSWHNLKDKVSWTLIVHSCLLLCLKALLGDGLWCVCLDSHLQRYYIEEDYWARPWFSLNAQKIFNIRRLSTRKAGSLYRYSLGGLGYSLNQMICGTSGTDKPFRANSF